MLHSTVQKGAGCGKVLDAVCTHVTSPAASGDSAFKLMADSYIPWLHIKTCEYFFNRMYGLQEKCKNRVVRFQCPLVYITFRDMQYG